jgi:hypothetical protein
MLRQATGYALAPRDGHPNLAGVPRPQEYLEHRALHGTRTGPLQEPLERLSIPLAFSAQWASLYAKSTAEVEARDNGLVRGEHFLCVVRASRSARAAGTEIALSGIAPFCAAPCSKWFSLPLRRRPARTAAKLSSGRQGPNRAEIRRQTARSRLFEEGAC